MTDATPSGVRVLAYLPDGSEVNVTAGVMALYDLVIGSMDWGSGFLTIDDALPVAEIARTCGFAGYPEAERYLAARAEDEERNAFYKATVLPAVKARGGGSAWRVEHEHVWSSRGSCLWPGCPVREETEAAAPVDGVPS